MARDAGISKLVSQATKQMLPPHGTSKIALRAGKDVETSVGKTKAQLKADRYAAKTQAKNFAKNSRTARKNLRAEAKTRNVEQRLLHGTIRQGIAQLGATGTAGTVAGINAVSQNTAGGVVEREHDNEDVSRDDQSITSSNGRGTVNKYSYDRRDE